MTDRENTIKGLESAWNYIDAQRRTYNSVFQHSLIGAFDNALQAIKDAITILQAQEPRVMTLYEVAKMAADFKDCALWFEPKEVDEDMWFMAYAQPVEGDETDIHIYEFGNDVPIEAKKYLYGKTWRCWTSRPTDEQREAAPWQK